MSAHDRVAIEYAQALRDYLRSGGDEAALARARELGRAALAGGVDVVEVSLRASHESTGELTRSLREAKEAGEQAGRELEALGYAVSHDLRAPIRAVDGFSQALEEDCADKLDARGLEHLARIRAAAKRMGDLLDVLLDLSRITRAGIARRAVDLTAISRQTAGRLRNHLLKRTPHRKVDVTVEDGLVATGDDRLVTVLVENLLGNAWKFTSKTAEGKIEIGQTREGTETVFFVRDNGAGFDQAFAHKLFAAFQRLHSSAEFDGVGIGLVTAQRIVHRHGGRIWAEGKVGQGAVFRFTLP